MSDNVIDFENFQKNLKPKTIIIVVIVLLLGLTALTSFYTVDQKEEAVVLFLGKFSKITGPGLHFKLPFGIEKNYNVPTQRNLREEFGFRTRKAGVQSEFIRGGFASESEMLTGDLNIVDVQWIIQYQISDPRDWLFNVQDQKKTIRDISQSVINQLVGDRTIGDVMGSERAQVQDQGKVLMNEILSQYKIGIRIKEVKLKPIVPPKGAVLAAFEDVNMSQQDRKRFINEGKESYNKAIPRARGQAKQIIQGSEGYATQKINKAKGDIARFNAVYTEYRKAPRVTRMRLYYEMFESVFNDLSTIELIDKKLKNFVPFKSLNETKQGGKK